MHSTMLENGLDFILDATEQLQIYENSTEGDAKRRALKYSLLHLLSGVELVMKSRLFIENWTYIFAKMEDANKEVLKNGTLKSVEYSKCIDRLKRFCDVEINNEKAFEDLRKCRNQVEHFYTKESLAAVASKINRALTATVEFLRDNYDEFDEPSVVDMRKEELPSLSDAEKEYIEKINSTVSLLQSHHSDAVSFAVKRTESIRIPEELEICPDCNEKVLVIADENHGGKCKCYLCGYEHDAEHTACEYLERVEGIEEYSTVKDGGEFPLYSCPDCGSHSFIEIENNYLCFSCRAEYGVDEVGFCSVCGSLYIVDKNEDIGICENCWEYIKHKTEKE